MRKIKSVQLFAFLLCIVISATACGSPTSKGTDSLVKQAMEFNNGKYYTTDNFLPFYCWGYPSQFAKERKEILNLFAEIDSGNDEWSSNPEVIKVKSKIGVNHDFIEYIVSDQATDDDVFYYFGESKNGVPNGAGILFDDIRQDHPVFGGNFDNGKVKGYGIIFDTLTGKMIFESEKCKYTGDEEFLASGKSIQYDNYAYSENYIDIYKQAFQDAGYEANNSIPSVLSIPPSVIYEGEMKDSKSSGDGQLYYSIYRSGTLSTKEVLYGPLQYDGEWKYDVFDGKGKYFNEDGSLEYEGKFRNGKIKN